MSRNTILMHTSIYVFLRCFFEVYVLISLCSVVCAVFTYFSLHVVCFMCDVL